MTLDSPCLGQPDCSSLETHSVLDNLGRLRPKDRGVRWSESQAVCAVLAPARNWGIEEE